MTSDCKFISVLRKTLHVSGYIAKDGLLADLAERAQPLVEANVAMQCVLLVKVAGWRDDGLAGGALEAGLMVRDAAREDCGAGFDGLNADRALGK